MRSKIDLSFVNELFERLSKSKSANDVQSAFASLNTIQDQDQRFDRGGIPQQNNQLPGG